MEEKPYEGPWIHEHDPDINLLFGKYGLSQSVWNGNDLFADLERCPPQLLQHLEEHYNTELDKLQKEQAMQIAELEGRSRHSSQQNSIKEIQLDKQQTMLARLQELKQELVVAFTIFSRTKFDETMDDDSLFAAIKKRFERALPLQYIDFVVV